MHEHAVTQLSLLSNIKEYHTLTRAILGYYSMCIGYVKKKK
jgi:hypothetical protein